MGNVLAMTTFPCCVKFTGSKLMLSKSMPLFSETRLALRTARLLYRCLGLVDGDGLGIQKRLFGFPSLPILQN